MHIVTNKQIKTKDAPDDRDRMIGLRVKAYREINGLSQTELGEKVGVTFQQIQKYESGKNKVSVSKLIDMCKILNTPLMTFLSGLADVQNTSVFAVSDVKQSKVIPNTDRDKEITELLKIYNSVENDDDRAEILGVLKALAAAKKKRTS